MGPRLRTAAWVIAVAVASAHVNPTGWIALRDSSARPFAGVDGRIEHGIVDRLVLAET